MGKVKLYDALKSSYGDKKSKKKLEQSGYVKDKNLSNNNQQVYYNSTDNKLLMNVAGTHNLKDWGTDIALAFGALKSTKRYKQADNTLEKAKSKYQGANTTVTGHSLGSSIGQKIVSKKDNDKFVGLDGGYTIGQKTRSYGGNQQHFRTQGDAVSLFGANAKNMTTLTNNNLKTGLVPYDVLKAHNVENIKDSNIYV